MKPSAIKKYINECRQANGGSSNGFNSLTMSSGSISSTSSTSPYLAAIHSLGAVTVNPSYPVATSGPWLTWSNTYSPPTGIFCAVVSIRACHCQFMTQPTLHSRTQLPGTLKFWRHMVIPTSFSCAQAILLLGGKVIMPCCITHPLLSNPIVLPRTTARHARQLQCTS